ncbi:hypothetical protein [Variovorax paradoxus]|uniref:hypothetical protein n=1 Tax=Variovorax paradoxus TaxID=34073 RepID=UPI0012D44D7E|nr:hypothetical protein [Variovorax paradoxus]
MLAHDGKGGEHEPNSGVPSGALDDVRLGRLAREWRDRAQLGDQIAHGVADAFEAEIQRRERRIEGTSAVKRVRKESAASRRWWKFW